ncbi:MAG: hypothetical protein AAB838_01115 [Patescibacteria group bacterium]
MRSRLIILFAALFTILIANSLYASYPDEFDNILGGKLILHGILPYSGFFSHHGPISYWIAAVINIFSGTSFVHFRLVLAVFYFGLFFIIYKILKKYVSVLFILALAVSMPFFWGQMLLADTLSAYLLVPAYGLFLYKSFLNEKLNSRDLWLISVFSALTVLNSPTYLYAVGFLALFTLLYSKNLKKFLIIFAIPYIIFGFYLLVTGSLPNFLYQEVNYNKSYYIYNYPRPPGSTSFNPIRYMVVIMNNFINQYQPLLAGLKGTDFRFPMTATLAVTNTVFWLYLLLKRKFLLLVSCFLVIVYVNARGNLGDVRATDYQMAVYFVLTLFNAFFLIKQKSFPVLIYILGFFWFFAGMFLLADFWRLNYTRYMGEAPLIYDRPAVAPIMNKLLTKNDYCWIGPFEFEEMYYANCRVPSLYHWILPQFAGIDKIKTEILADYTKNMPPVIIFRRDYSAFGQSAEYSRFFQDFLDKNYIQLPAAWRFKDSKINDFNLNENFNFRKDVADLYVQKLVDLGYLYSSK